MALRIATLARDGGFRGRVWISRTPRTVADANREEGMPDQLRSFVDRWDGIVVDVHSFPGGRGSFDTREDVVFLVLPGQPIPSGETRRASYSNAITAHAAGRGLPSFLVEFSEDGVAEGRADEMASSAWEAILASL